MATYNFGVVALHPVITSSHVLGFADQKTSGYILQLWSGSSDGSFVAGVDISGGWRAGNPFAESPTTTDGPFTYLRSINGPPTGTPAGGTNYEAPLVYDRANHKIYAYYGGTWRSTAALT